MKYVFENAKITIEGEAFNLPNADKAIGELAFLLEEYGYMRSALAELISIDLDYNGKHYHL